VVKGLALKAMQIHQKINQMMSLPDDLDNDILKMIYPSDSAFVRYVPHSLGQHQKDG